MNPMPPGSPKRRRGTCRRQGATRPCPSKSLAGASGEVWFRLFAVVGVSLTLGLAGCGPSAATAPDSGGAGYRDDLGRAVRLAGPVRRIVALTPAAVESLFAVGAGGRVVGATSEANHPAAAADIPRVGSFGPDTIDYERILALRPDLVLTAGALHEPVRKALDKLGVATFALEPAGIDDVRTQLLTLGRMTGHDDQAQRAAADFDAALADVADRLAGLASDDRPKCLVMISVKPLWTAGGGSFLDRVIDRAGGRNLFGDDGREWFERGVEEVVRRSPDVLIAGDSSADALAALVGRAGWDTTPAVRQRRFVTLDDDLFMRPGPRLPLAVRSLSEALHPDRFADRR